MTQLDINKTAIVGVSADKRGKIANCIEKRCEGCGCKVYLSSYEFREGKRAARRQKTGTVVVCWSCAEPWIQDVARNGGDVVGSAAVLQTDVMPRIERAQEDQLRSN